MVDEGLYYERRDLVVKVVAVRTETVEYEYVQTSAGPVTTDMSREVPVDHFEDRFDKCGAGVSFAGP